MFLWLDGKLIIEKKIEYGFYWEIEFGSGKKVWKKKGFYFVNGGKKDEELKKIMIDIGENIIRKVRLKSCEIVEKNEIRMLMNDERECIEVSDVGGLD